jgi:hypothetical protein
LLLEQPVLIIFVFFFLLIFGSGFLSHIIKLLRICKTLLAGESFHFDAVTGKIIKNKKQVAAFADIHKVEMRTIQHKEGQPYYRTSLILHSGAALFIAQSTEYEAIASMVDSMARIINVPVVAA